MSDRDSLLNKINALLNKTTENGASEHEAMTALSMAQKLMEKHMIESYELNENSKDLKCEKFEVEMFKTGYDTTSINGAIADCFDCKCWWNRHRGTVTFFGYGSDAHLASYFYNFINNAIVIESRKYKHGLEFIESKIKGYHTKTIMASFRKGMMIRIIQRLVDLKRERTSNVLKKTGTDLVVVKSETVKDEFKGLELKLKTKKSTLDDVQCFSSYEKGYEKGNKVNLSGGIENKKSERIKP